MEQSQSTQHATQQATQPYTDPRRQGRTLSQMSNDDAADIICVLHANSAMANIAVRTTMLTAPEHILQNEDLDGVTADDLALIPALKRRSREIALRMSSTVKLPEEGFRFGRNPASCDILLTDNPRDRLVSNVHFKIFVNDQGSLMIEDCSTNGTWLDDVFLKSKDKYGRPLAKPARRALKHGAMIGLVVGPERENIQLMIRIPTRLECEDMYEHNLREYLQLRGITAKFSSVRESSFGNHWHGGALYNFTGLLGKGAFATVYRVQTKSEGTVFAAKEIDQRRFYKNGILDVKFDNELQIMKMLKHPNIVDYVDCQTYKDWIYIIMEYVPYGELSKELAIRGRLSEPQVQQITKQTLRALDYLHRQGITHRDIKPDNILIYSREPLIVKLSDFGLSKSVVDQQTFLKTFCGTLLYCAPEVYPDYQTYIQAPSKRRRSGDQSSRTSPYNSSADMWSFGAVIFHLMAGKAPIIGRGDNQGVQMLSNIMTKPVDWGPLREVGISEVAIDFINALLNRQPALRPKEHECFDHLWLKSVPDILDYNHVENVDFRRDGRLDNVDEGDEEDDELIGDLQRLTQDQKVLRGAVAGPYSTPSSPERPMKKPKMVRDESTLAEEILYPHLPPVSQTPSSRAKAAPKLFGEITASVLKSSGLFGGIAGPASSPARRGDLPQISNRLEQVSMNDFASPALGDGRSAVQRTPKKPHLVHDVDDSYAGPPISGSAASMMGAQLGQMNMSSPKPAIPDAPRADTNNLVPPQSRDVAPARCIGQALDGVPSSQNSSRSTASDEARHIDVTLLADEEAFAAEQKVRQTAREENARLKAQTFHVPTGTFTPAAATAKTFDAPAQRSIRNSESSDHQSASSGGTEVLRLLSTNTFASSAHTFGKLFPVEGSFDNKPIPLLERSTLWGRALQCNCQYANTKDTRVPKFGMKIVFWGPGIEEVEKNGGDWTKVPKIRTIVATSATRGIQVNGIHLSQESDDGKAALFGKIYSGDIITILDGTQPGSYLKYRVEILFGDSAERRPEKEPFVIQKEYHYQARKKDQSMHMPSHHGDNTALLPPPDGVTMA